MHFSHCITLLLFFAIGSVVNAAPSSTDTMLEATEGAMVDVVDRASPTGGYGYEGNNLTGKQWTLTANGCHTLTMWDANDRWSSAEVLDGFRCKFYRNNLCIRHLPGNQGGEVTRTGPWSGGFPSGWNNKISSFKRERT